MNKRVILTSCALGAAIVAAGAAAGGPPWKGGPGGPGVQVPAIGAGASVASPKTPVMALPGAVPAGATPVTQNRSASGGAIVNPPGFGSSRSASNTTTPSTTPSSPSPASGGAGPAVSGTAASVAGGLQGAASSEGGSSGNTASPGAPTNVADLQQGLVAEAQQSVRDVRQLPSCR